MQDKDTLKEKRSYSQIFFLIYILHIYILFYCLQVEKHIKDTAQAQQQRELQQQTQKGGEMQ